MGEQYEPKARQIIESIQAIKNSVESHGFGTVTVMNILSELLRTTQIAEFYLALPQEEKNKFIGEVFDAAVGNEPHALVTQVGIFSGDVLETISDALKIAAVHYVNRRAEA